MIRRLFTLILIAFAFTLGFYFGQNPDAENFSSVSTATSTVSIIINKDVGFAEVIPRAELNAGESLFDLLKKTTKTKGIELSYKDYGGSMGMFITSIARTSASGDKWWQYWVNGQYANVGVSSSIPKAGDVVEFRLTNEQN